MYWYLITESNHLSGIYKHLLKIIIRNFKYVLPCFSKDFKEFEESQNVNSVRSSLLKDAENFDKYDETAKQTQNIAIDRTMIVHIIFKSDLCKTVNFVRTMEDYIYERSYQVILGTDISICSKIKPGVSRWLQGSFNQVN